MVNNKVSIIIPTKNNGDILEKCLAYFVDVKNYLRKMKYLKI